MPFTPYKSTFSPEDLGTLQDVFERAWADVSHSPGVMVDQQAARNMIAQRIVAAWRDQGERDPERLKSYAIKGIE